MNTYDFDKTVFYPDSSGCFYRWCLKKYPLRVLAALPGAIGKFAAYLRNKNDAGALKSQLFSFLKHIDDIDSEVAQFWEENFSRMESWYLAQLKEDDVIISASPEFLLKPVTDKLGVRLIGTPMDKRTGKLLGKNCHDSEKVRRFYEAFPEGHTECFYSDSLSDTPMAEIADKAFLVDRGRLSPWPNK